MLAGSSTALLLTATPNFLLHVSQVENMSAVPPSWKDLGKASNDLLGKGEFTVFAPKHTHTHLRAPPPPPLWRQ